MPTRLAAVAESAKPYLEVAQPYLEHMGKAQMMANGLLSHEQMQETLTRQAERTPWGGFSVPVLEVVAAVMVLLALLAGFACMIFCMDGGEDDAEEETSNGTPLSEFDAAKEGEDGAACKNQA